MFRRNGLAAASVLVLAVVLVTTVAQGEPVDQTVGGRTFVYDEGDWFETGSGGRTRILPSQLTIGFHPEAGAEQVASFIDSLGLELRYDGWRGLKHFRLPPGLNPVEAYAIARASDLVVFAEPALEATWHGIPSDGLWPRQWNMKAHRQDFLHAWEIEPGDSTVIIAILDTGVNLGHQDLRGNLWRNWDEIPLNQADDDSNGFVDDYWGWDFLDGDGDVSDDDDHGAYVTGLACATTNSDTVGIAGPAGGWCDGSWSIGDRGNGCRAMTLVVCPSSDDVTEAIVYAVENGADVANMSFGWGTEPALVDSVIAWADSMGLVLCASTGNQNAPGVYYPARDSLVLGVGAAFRNDDRAFFSAYGYGVDVLAASGACVDFSDCYEGPRSTCVEDWLEYWDAPPPGCNWYPMTTTPFNSEYGRFSGTSAASPQAAGLAALLRSFNPSLTTAQVRYLIRHSAEDQLGGSTMRQGMTPFTAMAGSTPIRRSSWLAVVARQMEGISASATT
jgi:subtilisin family serine protease